LETQIYVYNTRSKLNNVMGFLGILIMVILRRKYSHSATRIIDNSGDFIYECDENGFVRKDYKDWLKNTKIILSCNANKHFNLSENNAKAIKNKAEYLLNQELPYGYLSLLGIIGWLLFKKKSIGIDGNVRLICSESSYVLFEDYIEGTDCPQDYITPKTLEIWFFNK